MDIMALELKCIFQISKQFITCLMVPYIRIIRKRSGIRKIFLDLLDSLKRVSCSSMLLDLILDLNSKKVLLFHEDYYSVKIQDIS